MSDVKAYKFWNVKLGNETWKLVGTIIRALYVCEAPEFEAQKRAGNCVNYLLNGCGCGSGCDSAFSEGSCSFLAPAAAPGQVRIVQKKVP
jgi:hypothetical protein